MRMRLALSGVVLGLAGCLNPEPGDPCTEQADCGAALRCVAAGAEEGVCQGLDEVDPASLMYEPASVEVGDIK